MLENSNYKEKLRDLLIDKKLTATTKIVYIYLLVWVGEENTKPRTEISKDIGISNVTLGKHLKKLSDRRYITKVQTRGNGRFSVSKYTILK